MATVSRSNSSRVSRMRCVWYCFTALHKTHAKCEDAISRSGFAAHHSVPCSRKRSSVDGLTDRMSAVAGEMIGGRRAAVRSVVSGALKRCGAISTPGTLRREQDTQSATKGRSTRTERDGVAYRASSTLMVSRNP